MTLLGLFVLIEIGLALLKKKYVMGYQALRSISAQVLPWESESPSWLPLDQGVEPQLLLQQQVCRDATIFSP